MPAVTPMWTDIGTIILVAAQTAILLAAAVVAYVQVREARRLREDKARPVVVVDFDISESSMFVISIANIGATMARDVRVMISPPLTSSLDNQTEQLAKLKVFTDAIETLAAGKRISTLFDSPIQRTPGPNYPDVYEARVTYWDEHSRRSFEERMTLDLGLYWGIQRLDQPGIDDIHARLRDIAKSLDSWSSSSGVGLVRLSPSEEQARHEENRSVIAERRARREAEREGT